MLFDFLPTDQERVAFRHTLHVDCQIVRERDFRLVGRRTLDISATGVQIVAELADVAIGESVIVSFRAPRTDRWIDAEGVIARVIDGRRRGDVARAAGVHFAGMDRTSFTSLKTALRRLPATRARRPSRLDYAAMTRVVSLM